MFSRMRRILTPLWDTLEADLPPYNTVYASHEVCKQLFHQVARQMKPTAVCELVTRLSL